MYNVFYKQINIENYKRNIDNFIFQKMQKRNINLIMICKIWPINHKLQKD